MQYRHVCEHQQRPCLYVHLSTATNRTELSGSERVWSSAVSQRRNMRSHKREHLHMYVSAELHGHELPDAEPLPTKSVH